MWTDAVTGLHDGVRLRDDPRLVALDLHQVLAATENKGELNHRAIGAIVETRRFRTATNFDIMKRVMFRPKQKHKLGVNVMFYAFNQYYHRHYEQ